MVNNKQKSYLRSLANNLKAVILVGKDGCTFNLYQTTKDALEAHELIKVSVLKNCPQEVREVAFDLSSNSQADIVAIIGRVIILYKPSKKNRKIILP